MINLWLVNMKQLFLSIHTQLNSGKYFKHQRSNNQLMLLLLRLKCDLFPSQQLHVFFSIHASIKHFFIVLYDSVGCEICKV